MHLLAVGAHAADMEFTAGAAILRYTRAGHTATILALTPGEKGHPRMEPEPYAQQKIEEAHEAARRLSAQARLLDYKDAELLVDEQVALQIASVIREERPDILITHPAHSIHSDHSNCHANVMRAEFLAGIPGIQLPHVAYWVPKTYYAENWEDMEGYVPDTYVDVTDIFDDWIHAASAYELFRGGISTFRYQDYYRALAVMRGCLGGAQKAVTLMRPPGFGRQRGQFPL